MVQWNSFYSIDDSTASGIVASMTHLPSAEEIQAMSPAQLKVLENRLRQAAKRQGLELQKSRRHDPNALLYGTYQLVDQDTNGVVFADWALQRGYGLHLDDVADYLFGEQDPTR